jgi:hypothetical protein
MARDHVKDGITKRWADIRSLTPGDLPEPYIMFAFPPCTHLAVSGARWFAKKGLQSLIDGLELVEAARRICEWSGCPWMIENPVGRLSTLWRKPDYLFQPWEFGDNYSKKTCIWTGPRFRFPKPSVTEKPENVEELIWRMGPSDDRSDMRSITPRGFAQAVFEANSE